MRILVVEDDGVAAAITDALVRRGHGVVRTTRAADVAAHRRDADLVLLDLNLPDGDGSRCRGRCGDPPTCRCWC